MDIQAPKLTISHGLMLRQFFRFTGVGAVGTAAHYLTLALLTHFGIHSTVATSIGALAGAVANYWLNYHFTFQSQLQHSVAVKRFFAIAAVGWLLNAALFQALHVQSGLNLWLAQIATTALVLVWNFAGNRWWTFGERTDD